MSRRGEQVLPRDRPTELEVHTLQRLANGLTMEEVAAEECLTRTAIAQRVKRMADRLSIRAQNTTHLIVISMRRGWIT